MRFSWLSRLAHSRVLLRHVETGEHVVSCGSSLSDVVFTWKVKAAANGLYEVDTSAKSRPVLINVLRFDADPFSFHADCLLGQILNPPVDGRTIDT